MKVLEQWVCDSCHEVIDGAGNGYLEWLSDEKHRDHSFRIVHHRSACQYPSRTPNLKDMPLSSFTGTKALPHLYMFLDPGVIHNPDKNERCSVISMPEFVEILKRLTIAHYEEARIYWDQATNDGFFDGANEWYPYIPETLQTLISRYKTK